MNCNICNSALNNKSIGKHQFFHCPNCQVLKTKDIPEKEKLKMHYKDNYKIQDLSSNLKREKRRISRLPEQVKLIADIKKYVSNSEPKLLDFGCGDGFFLDEARRYGLDCYGVELSESSANYAKSIGLKVEDDIDNYEVDFNVITLWHVFEHIPEPNNFLKLLHSKLINGGKLFIRVPAIDNIWLNIFRDKWIWLQPENHYFHYTKKALEILIKKNGFKIEMLKKQKPNNYLTKLMTSLVDDTYEEYFDDKESFLRKVKRSYENLVGIEYYLIATKV